MFVLHWRDLKAMLPIISNVVNDLGVDYTSQQLLKGRLDTRNAHLRSVSAEIGQWHTFEPPLTVGRGARGFLHMECGRLLCPPLYNWGDPT